MTADGALSGVAGFAFAVELQKRAHQNRIACGRGAIIALEGRGRLARRDVSGRPPSDRSPSRCRNSSRIAVRWRNPRPRPEIPPAAMAGGDRSKRPLGFADDVKSSAQPAAEVMGTRRVKREVAAGCAPPCADRGRGLSPARPARSAPRPRPHAPEAKPERQPVPSQRGARARERGQTARPRRSRRRNPIGNDAGSSMPYGARLNVRRAI